MKPQAQIAPVNVYPENDPLPPVVIKIGGGQHPPNVVPINIGSDKDSRIYWTVIDRSNKAPVTWTRARTTLNGRIHGLTIEDPAGSQPVLKINPQKDVLTTLNMYFASDQDSLEFSEVPGEGSIHMEAKSNGLFEAESPTPDDRWISSNATFLSALVRVEFRQRQIGSDVDFMRFEYLVNSNVVDVSLDYQES